MVIRAAMGWWPVRRLNTQNPPRAITRTASTCSMANAGWSVTMSCVGSGAHAPADIAPAPRSSSGGHRATRSSSNWLVDCHRGIALGLVAKQDIAPDRPDHEGGVIRRNAICNLNSWADEAIEVNASPGTQVVHNTVLVEGKVPWSISIRFPTANARAWNNLCNRQIILRNGAKAELKANIVTAGRDWFVNSGHGDLRLARGDLPAIDAGIVTGADPASADRQAPFVGPAPDAGAFEYRGQR